MLDLRIPTGFFFALVGLILLCMGIFSPGERAALTEANVNLYCGIIMLAFGGGMLALARFGRGLSSSAALEVSSALAFLRGRDLDKLRLAKLCQSAERNFVGMPCGIMDQYISVFGREHSAVEIDCRSLTHRYVPLPDGFTFL